MRMTLAGLQLPFDWGVVPLAFGAGLLWRQPPTAVHLHCPEALVSAAPVSQGGVVPWILVAVAFIAGGLVCALCAGGRPLLRFRRARALFDR